MSVFSRSAAPLSDTYCCCANLSFINLTILNQLFVQTKYRMKVCVVWAVFPVQLCVVIQRHGGNVANTLVFSQPLFLGCGFSHRLVSACLAATSEVWTV